MELRLFSIKSSKLYQWWWKLMYPTCLFFTYYMDITLSTVNARSISTVVIYREFEITPPPPPPPINKIHHPTWIWFHCPRWIRCHYPPKKRVLYSHKCEFFIHDGCAVFHPKMASVQWYDFMHYDCRVPYELTHCGLVTLYGDIDLSQHCLG